MTTFLSIAFILISLLMILVVLVQRGRGGGVASAFGGGGGQQSAFGTKTGDVFTTITVVLFVLFIGFAIGLNKKMQTEEADHMHTNEAATQAVAGAGGNQPEAPKATTPVEVTTMSASAPATSAASPATSPLPPATAPAK